jgi:hypothetical protein
VRIGLGKLRDELPRHFYFPLSKIKMVKSVQDGLGMQHEWGRREMHVGYWWDSQSKASVGGNISGRHRIGWYGRH